MMTSEVHPLIQIVDENDTPLRGATMDEAQANGLWHRIVRVMVFDTATERYLLQKVPQNPYYNGGLWNTTASGHVDESESYEYAAARELEEEMGLADVGELHEVDRYDTEWQDGVKLYRRKNVTFEVRLDMSTRHAKPNAGEVEEIKWVSATDLLKMAHAEDAEKVITGGLRKFALNIEQGKTYGN